MSAPWLEDADETKSATPALIGKLLAERAKKLELLAALEANVLETKARIRVIEEQLLPEILDQMGITKLTDAATGKTLILDNVVTATLTNPGKRAAAIAWLRSHGLTDLISCDVVTRFKKGDDETATAVAVLLEMQGYVVAKEDAVNTTSYKAALKELMEQGEAIPGDEAGVFVVRKVIVK